MIYYFITQTLHCFVYMNKIITIDIFKIIFFFSKRYLIFNIIQKVYTKCLI